jgi:peptidoglycan/LPS O-acetylase OafA/YrhL
LSDTRHIPEVDGLRAIAATMVVLFHAAPLQVTAGWSGVWIFYVISGFVITLALDGRGPERKSVSSSLLDFYSRRAFRILPLYFLAVLTGACVHAASGALGEQFWTQLLAQVTFTFNFLRMDPSFEHSMMTGHLWSISVEEHFYLLFPLLYFLLPPRLLAPALFGVVALAMLIRLGMSLAFAGDEAETIRGPAIYMFSPAHFDAFAIGALLAVGRVWVMRQRWLAPALGLAVVAGWMMLWLAWPADSSANPGHSPIDINASWLLLDVFRYTLLSLTAAATIVAILQGASLPRLVLGWRPLVYAGRISFGIYVFHFPIQMLLADVIFRSGAPSPLVMFLCSMTLSLLAASASFHLFERPIQRLRPKERRSQQVPAPAIPG